MKYSTKKNSLFSLIVVGIIFLLLLASFVFFFRKEVSFVHNKTLPAPATKSNGSTLNDKKSIGTQLEEQGTIFHHIQQESLKDMAIGEKDAPITVIEYASLTCSHCADFYKDVFPFIHKKYILEGKVRFIFREFASDPRAVAGFMLARCVEKDRYFPFLQVLFEKQFDWAFIPDNKTILLRISKLAGLNEEQFLACLSNQQLLDKLNNGIHRAEKFGVNVIPTFFINSKKYEGAMSFKQISSILDNILGTNRQEN